CWGSRAVRASRLQAACLARRSHAWPKARRRPCARCPPRSAQTTFRRESNTGTTSLLVSFTQALRRVQCSRDNRQVAGAAADMAAQKFAQLGFARFWLLTQIPVERHQDPGGAEAALQGVMTPECLLKNREAAGLRRKPFDGADRRAIRLHGERQAG